LDTTIEDAQFSIGETALALAEFLGVNTNRRSGFMCAFNASAHTVQTGAVTYTLAYTLTLPACLKAKGPKPLFDANLTIRIIARISLSRIIGRWL
jgi:hypothetical protein